jgi:hypothetical protein
MDVPSSQGLRQRLNELGLSRQAIEAAWPGWWAVEAESSTSARAELAFAISRRLGLDPRTVIQSGAPIEFARIGVAEFKHLSGETEQERLGIASFGQAVARAALAGAPEPQFALPGREATAIRQAILSSGRPYVELIDLIALSWSAGVPVIQLRIFPWRRKRMAAMTVRSNGRYVILLAKESTFPAAIAFYVAHEVGHIASGHLDDGATIVDFDDTRPLDRSTDGDEQAADAYALTLLTGRPDTEILPEKGIRSGIELARVASGSAASLGIEAGTIAEVFGHSTGEWPIATAALRRIYPNAPPVWLSVNQVARQQLDFERMPADSTEFLELILGEAGQ